MQDLVDTTEMYIKAIVELEEQNIVPLRARIAERLGHSGPTVSQTVARLERDGLLFVGGNRQLVLTPTGREMATSVMLKHRLAERLLYDVIGLEWSKVHNEACRWEHVMSDDVTAKIQQLLPNATTSPYGNPMPGTEDPRGVSAADLKPLPYLPVERGEVTAEIIWFGEPLQVDEHLLEQCKLTGVLPGAAVTVTKSGEYYTLAAGGASEVLDLPTEMAQNVFVVERS